MSAAGAVSAGGGVVSGVEIVTEASEVLTAESGAGVLIVVSDVLVLTEVSGVLVLELLEVLELGALEVCEGPVGWSQVPGVVTDWPFCIEKQYGACVTWSKSVMPAG